MYRVSNSYEWVTHERGQSEELVRRREKERWDLFFKHIPLDIVLGKLNNILPPDRKAVMIPAKSAVIIVNPYKPQEVAGALQDACDAIGAQLDVTLTPLLEKTVQPPQNTDPAPRILLDPIDVDCFRMLFEGKNLGYVANKLNLVWLPDHLKVLFPRTTSEVIIVDRKDIFETVARTKELLASAVSPFTIDVMERENIRSVFMEVV